MPTIVIDAKTPKEKIDNWESQRSSYCLEINKLYEFNPVQYFILSNGLKTSVYKWDVKKPLMTLKFDDFVTTSTIFSELEDFLHRKKTKSLVNDQLENLENKIFRFQKITLDQLFS